jgi:hypothetical protein
MGVRLMVEVLDHAPSDLPPREVLALIAIAESANDATRTGWPGRAKIARRARISERACKALTDRLQEKGLLEKVRRGNGRSNATVWRLPCYATKGEAETSPFSDDGKGEVTARKGEVSSSKGEAQTSPLSSESPQEPSSLSGPERTIADATGATEDETREIIFLIKRDNNPRNPAAYVRALAKNGDLPELLERVRAEARQRAARRNPPPPPPVEPEPATVTPEERDAAVAAARALLRNARTQTRRGEGGPQRLTPHTDVEPPPGVQAAHAYLLGRGDASDWLEAARAKLGTDAERGDVLVLAAELARA